MSNDKKKDPKWSTEAKVGAAAAVGSAALVAALLYANHKKKDRKLEPQSPDVPPAPPAPNQTGGSE